MDYSKIFKFDRQENVNIEIKNLTVWSSEKKSWWNKKIIKPKNIILKNGNISHGEFMAVLGPSGAGKTTYLVSLAGKNNMPSEGAVTINGMNVKNQSGIVEIVPQFEVFMDRLTVMEHLTFMTEMKLGSCKELHNKIRLTTILLELKLRKHANTPICSLSGGEKRLLSLANLMLSNPKVLICDEPTTGLDSYNALLVTYVLKKLAVSGKIVVCSVHQPSSALFKEFNSIMLMSEGRVVFQGNHRECKEVFDSIGLHCPINFNPAEFYINAMSPSSDINANVSDKLYDKYRDRLLRRGDSFDKVRLPLSGVKLSKRHWLKQIHLLLWRSSLTLKMDIKDYIYQLFISVGISAVLMCTCYVGISGTTQRGVQDLRGFLWLLTSEVCFSLSYAALYSFESTLTLYRREAAMYDGSAYFASKFLCFLPRCIIWPCCYVAIATLAVSLPNHAITSLEFILSLVVAGIASGAYGLSMGAMFTSSGMMDDVMPTVDLPLLLMSGAFLRISSLPVWLHPIKYISHFFYGMDAINNVYWRQIDYIECPSNSTSNCVRDGLSVLIENGYSSNFILEDGVGLLAVTTMWCLLGYYGLKREERKGYAY